MRTREFTDAAGAKVVKSGLAGAVLASFLVVGTARAVEWQHGDLQINLEGQLSQSTFFRTSGIDHSLIGPARGGTGPDDDHELGNLNYRPGSLVASPFNATAAVEATYQNYRALFRGNFLYDPEILYDRRPYPLSSDAKAQDGLRGRLLDAYVAGTYTPFDHNLEIKVGRQVIYWGESQFSAFGINQLNTLDLFRLREPGATLKDALLPTGVVAATFQANRYVTVQGFYEFERVVQELDPVGTFFSNADFVGAGAGTVQFGPTATVRSPDSQVSRSPQGGIAAFANPTPNIGVGLFFENLHARTPQLDFSAATSTVSRGQDAYHWVYPSNIQTYGASFNTRVGNAAVAGEVSYRPNAVVNLDATAVGLAQANADICGGFGQPLNCTSLPTPYVRLLPTPFVSQPNGVISGTARAKQVNALYNIVYAQNSSDLLVRTLRADGGQIIFENSYTYTDLPNKAVSPAFNRAKLQAEFFLLATLDYYRVLNSDWTVTPKFFAVARAFGNSQPDNAFYGNRVTLQGAVEFHRDSPQLSFELSYTHVTDVKAANYGGDKDYAAIRARYTF